MVILEETKIVKILLGIINITGRKGLKLENLEREFKYFCGFSLPYKQLGHADLRSWLLTLPDIYLVKDENDEERLFQHSQKSYHIRQLIYTQKNSQENTPSLYFYKNKKNEIKNIKKTQKMKFNPNNSHIHQSVNNVSANETKRFKEFNKLESMLPLFYNHQALGDDFLLDIADTKFGYYVPEQGPDECGLCCSNQTIAQLTQKVKNTKYLAPRVVVMIGLADLLMRRNVNDMIVDLHSLVCELKNKNTRVTLVTLVPTPKMEHFGEIYYTRMHIFNNAIMDYSYCAELKCNVIDMNAIFQEEQSKFQRNHDRLTKITKKDKYRVFSDFGRKVFISNLKSCLVEQLEAGH